MKANTDPSQYGTQAPLSITVWPLSENRRPVGFAPWPQEAPKKKRKKKKA